MCGVILLFKVNLDARVLKIPGLQDTIEVLEFFLRTHMRNLKGSTSLVAAIGLATLATTAGAPAPEKFIADCDRFGYIGTVSVYNTFADAQAGKNARVVNVVMPQRDGSIYLSKAMGGEWSEFNAFLTNWSDGPDPEKPGHGNPNNMNHGFIQMYDNNADNWQNQKAYWSEDLQTFTVETKGKNAAYPSVEEPGEYARLWHAPNMTGPGENTKGTFWRYEMYFQATGLNGADSDGDGFYENSNNATSFRGYFKAIFRNESERNPAANGYYVVNVTFNNVSWAGSNGYTENDTFGSSVVKKN